MRNAFIRGLTALAERDRRVVLLTGDLGFKIFDDFAARFPRRFFNAGVAEANMMSVAGGLALGGLRPFAYSIVPFATLRCLEQIRNDICYQEAAATVVGVGGGYSYGPNGATHHALEDIAIMRCLPNMTVVCPGDPVEAELAALAAGTHAGPLYLRLGRAGDEVVHTSPPPFSIGRALVLSEGSDCALIATGGILPVAVAAAEQLAREGISCRLVSMHTVKPLDEVLLRRCAAEFGVLFTIEEHGLIGGFGSAVGEWLAASGVRCRLRSFGTRDGFAHLCGDQKYFRQLQGLTAEHIARQVLEALKDCA
ncbi:MAG TPA: transketolase C-terminal domain-containing protein [Terriglobia bacterium]|nr:transketolase C-terminal domain-containing protein [Terriglobia bacterium]